MVLQRMQKILLWVLREGTFVRCWKEDDIIRNIVRRGEKLYLYLELVYIYVWCISFLVDCRLKCLQLLFMILCLMRPFFCLINKSKKLVNKSIAYLIEE